MLLRPLLIVALLLQTAPGPAFDANRAWEDLRHLVALGPRPAGSSTLDQARTYVKNQLGAAHVAYSEQAWDDQTPVGPVHMVNIVATIPGVSSNRLVIAGHYDTK